MKNPRQSTFKKTAVALVMGLCLMQAPMLSAAPAYAMAPTYGEFLQQVEDGKVLSVTIDDRRGVAEVVAEDPATDGTPQPL